MEHRRIYETWPAEPAPPPLGPDDEVVFNAEVRPNRSLPNTGFYALMTAIALVSFTAGIAFMLAGAGQSWAFSASMSCWSGWLSAFPTATGGGGRP